MFISYEILYSRRVGKPLLYNIKRLTGRLVILITGVSTFVIILGVIYLALLTLINEGNVLLYSGVIWFVCWIGLFWRFRKVFERLYRGCW